MTAVKKFRLFLLVSASGFSLSSIAVCFIAILKTLPYESQQKASYVIAALFWITLAVGIVFLKLADKQRKICESKLGKSFNSKCGAVSFMQNREAKIADAVFIVLLVLVIIVSAVHMKNNSLGIVFAGIMFLSFDIHSFLNGKNYQCYKSLKGQGF